MIHCPNFKSKEWIELANEVGESDAIRAYKLNDNDIPSIEYGKELLERGVTAITHDIDPIETNRNVSHKIASERVDTVNEYLKMLDSDEIAVDTDALRIGGYVIKVDTINNNREVLDRIVEDEKQRLNEERDVLREKLLYYDADTKSPEYKDAYNNHAVKDINNVEVGTTKEPVDADKYSPRHAWDTALKLKKHFDDATGLQMDVIEDHTLDASGKLVYVNDIPHISINPNRLRTDTVYHEFGHVLVDTIGYKDPIIQRGIEQLIDTKLADVIRLKHPELNKEQFEKELLTTAIGTAATKFIRSPKALADWNFWLNRFYRAFNDVLNKISNGKFGERTDVAKQLAVRLINGEIGHKLLYRPVKYVQYQIDRPKQLDVAIDTGLEVINKSNNNLTAAAERFKNIRSFVTKAEETIELNSLPKLVASRDLNQISEALGRVIKYDLNISKGLLDKFDGWYDTLVNKNGGTRLLDIPIKERNELLDNMQRANEFLETFSNIASIKIITDKDIANLKKELEKTTNPADVAELTKYISDMENYMTTLEDSRLEVSKNRETLQQQMQEMLPKVSEYIMRFSTNPEREAIGKDIIMGMMGEDVGFVGAWLDSLIKSSNPYAANIALVMHMQLQHADVEEGRLSRKLYDIQKLIEGTRFTADDIKENGSFVRKYDFGKFEDDLKEALGGMSKDDPGFYDKFTSFMQENTSRAINPETRKVYTNEDIVVAIRKAKLTMSKQDFADWQDENFSIGKDGKYYPRVYSQYLALDNYVNDKWKTIQSEPKLKEYYEGIMSIMAETTEGYSNQQANGLLPAVPSKEFRDAKKKIPIEHNDEVRVGINGKQQRIIPYRYVGYLGAIKSIKMPREHVDETHKAYLERALKIVNESGNTEGKVFTNMNEVYAENARIKTENIKNHAANIEPDLTKSMLAWIKASTEHKYKKEIESQILLALREFKEGTVHKRSAFSGAVMQSKELDPEGIKRPAEFTMSDTNIVKQVESAVNAILYNETVNPNKYNNILRGTKNYVSMLGMGFNAFANVKNITRGTAILAAESLANIMFTSKQLADGYKEYFQHMTSYIADADVLGKKGGNPLWASNKVNAFFKQMPVMKHVSDTFEMSDNAALNQAYLQHMFTSAAFIGQEIGSHMLQNASYLAMLHSHHLMDTVDGRKMFVSLFDITNRDYKPTEPNKFKDPIKNKEYNDAIMASNKEMVARRTAEFNQAPSVFDVYDYKDGFNDLKEEYKDVDPNAMAQFRLRVVAANHEIHGVYDKVNRGQIEQSLVGQMAVQFRKWMRPGWNARYGYRGGVLNIVPTWDEASQTQNVGTYKAFGKFIFSNPISADTKEMFHSGDPVTIARAVGNTIMDYGKFISNAKVYWHMLTPVEQAGVKRASAEFATMGILFAGMLMGIRYRNQDEKRKNNAWLNFGIYQLDAVRTELMSFLPVVGWIENGKKVLANPTATVGAMTTVGKLVSDICAYPFQTPDERVLDGGKDRGDNRIFRDVVSGTPVANVYQRLVELSRGQDRAYAMWGGTSIGSSITEPDANSGKDTASN